MNRRLAPVFTALAVAGALAPASAEAGDAGAAVAAGIGGFALGAIAGGALAQPAPPPAYYPAPAYAPVYEHCWRERRPVFDEYGDVIGFRRQRVCE
jgi:hypothetical protein